VNAFARLSALLAVLAAAAPAAAAEPSFPIDQVLGRPDAPVTIYDYSSTTCGHCATFHGTTLPKIKAEWIDTGKAKLVFRDFPTAPADLSLGASMIVHCAGPDLYFRLLGLLFEQQDRWMGAANPLDAIKKLTKLAGMGEAKVDACLTREDLAQAIETRAKDAHDRFGIDGTPSFVINGKVLSGARPYEEFDKALKAATAAAK
jgi:protein-disulfide isomerase